MLAVTVFLAALVPVACTAVVGSNDTPVALQKKPCNMKIKDNRSGHVGGSISTCLCHDRKPCPHNWQDVDRRHVVTIDLLSFKGNPITMKMMFCNDNPYENLPACNNSSQGLSIFVGPHGNQELRSNDCHCADNLPWKAFKTTREANGLSTVFFVCHSHLEMCNVGAWFTEGKLEWDLCLMIKPDNNLLVTCKCPESNPCTCYTQTLSSGPKKTCTCKNPSLPFWLAAGPLKPAGSS